MAMKSSLQPRIPSRLRRGEAGYTLVEVMFVSFIMILVVLALLSAQLVGFRIGKLVDSKSGASDSSRLAIRNLMMDIRSAKMWSIGNLDSTGTNFVAITNGLLQGPALQLCQTTNGSQFTVYYFQYLTTNNSALMKASIPSWSASVVCSNLIDHTFFTAELFNGQLQTNSIANVNNFKNVIHVILDFCQFQYPLTQVGTNGLYDFYKLEFRATPHLPE
jgi:hypothetical protein